MKIRIHDGHVGCHHRSISNRNGLRPGHNRSSVQPYAMADHNAGGGCECANFGWRKNGGGGRSKGRRYDDHVLSDRNTAAGVPVEIHSPIAMNFAMFLNAKKERLELKRPGAANLLG